MKRRYFRRLTSAALVMLMAFVMLFVSVGEVKAASDDFFITLPDVMWANFPSAYSVSVRNMTDGKEYKVVGATSSNTKVVSISKEKIDGKTYRFANFKKAGTATVKVTFKKGGTRKTISKKITVKKYPYPVKSLKVGSTTVNISKHKYNFTKKYTGTAPKIKMAAKNGFTISSVYGFYYDKNWNTTKATVKKSQIKNGSKLSFPKKYRRMQVTVVMTNKSGDRLEYTVYLTRE